MKITKLTPQGFCKGVTKAIYIINKALEDENIQKPIYMLGNIVHNKNIVKAFENKGIIILDGESRLKMLDHINQGTVIFTAHGVSEAVKEKAIKKGLNIIDATCRDVKRTHQIIKDKLSEGYHILFYGKEGHPETEGVLGLSKQITLVNKNTSIEQLPFYSGKMILTNQTTMSYHDVIEYYEILKNKYPQLELLEEVCSATRRRQEAVAQAKDFDLCIIVGDHLSNNTKMLKEVSESKAHINAILVEDVKDLQGIDFTKYKNIAITAGASTPNAIVEEIIQALINKEQIFISKLTDLDYLK